MAEICRWRLAAVLKTEADVLCYFTRMFGAKHGRRSVGRQRTCPLLYKVYGTPCVMSPYFGPVDIVNTMIRIRA